MEGGRLDKGKPSPTVCGPCYLQSMLNKKGRVSLHLCVVVVIFPTKQDVRVSFFMWVMLQGDPSSMCMCVFLPDSAQSGQEGFCLSVAVEVEGEKVSLCLMWSFISFWRERLYPHTSDALPSLSGVPAPSSKHASRQWSSRAVLSL